MRGKLRPKSQAKTYQIKLLFSFQLESTMALRSNGQSISRTVRSANPVTPFE